MSAIPSRLPPESSSCLANRRARTPASLPSSPSPFAASPSPTEPHDDDDDDDDDAGPDPSGCFNRLTFSVGFPHLTRPDPAESASPATTAIQTISLYFDASFIPREPLFAVLDDDGFSCASSPPSRYAPVPFSPYTAITSHTVIHFSESSPSNYCRRRRALYIVFCTVCFAISLLLYCLLALDLLVLLLPTSDPFPTTALSVTSSPLPIQDNITRILHLHDEALVPLMIPNDDDDNDDDENNNTTSLALLGSLHAQITDFCLLLAAQAAPDTDIIYTNRVCGWASDTMRELRVAWLQASTFYNNSMSFSTPHWLRSLARELANITPSDNNTNGSTSKHVLTAILAFLDPEAKEGLLPRSLRKGHTAVNKILPELDTLKREIERLATLADDHGIVPDADAQLSQATTTTTTNPLSSIWQSCRQLLVLSDQGRLAANANNWTDAAVKGDKALLAVHASRMLAQLTQRANSTIVALERQVADAEARFRDANKAVSDVSGALRALLDTFTLPTADQNGTTARTPESPWLAACKNTIRKSIRWLFPSSMTIPGRHNGQGRRRPPQQTTPWVTHINHDYGLSPTDHQPCHCAPAVILWYVPEADGIVSYLRDRALAYTGSAYLGMT
ncbi:hypothetical protein CSUB01_04601 [Colletotrichum sublineola]|uniref:Uncharacterized protein n=1 Tax=Colletotrichum sublineola TaxID=1173701 RepID=A0A066X0U2_COLSU|nr:hypothetical protein CSUB01_04601 [Colletotrichum sublineola]